MHYLFATQLVQDHMQRRLHDASRHRLLRRSEQPGPDAPRARRLNLRWKAASSTRARPCLSC